MQSKSFWKVKCEKTYRGWVWYFIRAINTLKDSIIVWENRFIRWNQVSQALSCFDGVDCQVTETYPFDPQLKSEKFNDAASKYLVGVSIINSDTMTKKSSYDLG